MYIPRVKALSPSEVGAPAKGYGKVGPPVTFVMMFMEVCSLLLPSLWRWVPWSLESSSKIYHQKLEVSWEWSMVGGSTHDMRKFH